MSGAASGSGVPDPFSAAPAARTADVLVVGAGPAGSSAAWHLATAGLDVAVVEKARFPREKVCGDGLTPRGVKALTDMGVDVSPAAGWVRHRGLRVFGGGQVVEVDWHRLASWPDHGLIRSRRDLDPMLAAHAAAAGARVQVVRGQTRRYSARPPAAWLAGVGPGERFLERLTIERPEDLLDLRLDRGAGTPDPELLLLACTHSTRDPCCARFGLPLVREVLAAAPGRTWHTSHLGGHRFAATLLALPSGLVLGRLGRSDAVDACRALERGDLPLDRCRGRTGSTPQEQVLELHVAAGGSPDVDVVAVPGDVRRQSCGDLSTKPTTVFEVRPR